MCIRDRSKYNRRDNFPSWKIGQQKSIKKLHTAPLICLRTFFGITLLWVPNTVLKLFGFKMGRNQWGRNTNYGSSRAFVLVGIPRRFFPSNLSLSLSVCLSVCLSVSISVYLSRSHTHTHTHTTSSSYSFLSSSSTSTSSFFLFQIVCPSLSDVVRAVPGHPTKSFLRLVFTKTRNLMTRSTLASSVIPFPSESNL